MKWTEISNDPENKRFEVLSAELNKNGFKNQFVPTLLPNEFCKPEFFEVEENCERFRDFLKKIKNEYSQIRVGGFFKEKLDLFSHEYPAELIHIKTFDSMVKDGTRWWPRNQLLHAFVTLLNREIKQVDFLAPILILGANPQSKTVILALIKLGFANFNITDLDASKSRALVQDLSRKFFSVHFEMTEIGYVTQLPSIYSMGINTLSGELDETTKMAIVYFNFLPQGGFWIETFPRATSVLADEAKNFGFHVWMGVDLIASADVHWARSVLNCQLDSARLKESYVNEIF